MITAVGTPDAEGGDDEFSYTLGEVAFLLETSIRVVYGLVRDGTLRGTQVASQQRWRVTRGALREYVERDR